MELPQFEGQRREELAMIDVAHAILEVKGEITHFDDLLNEVADYLQLSDEQLEASMVQFYTDLNVDGSFISLGENRWGLREWYPVDSIDEEITHDNDEEDERPRRRKRRKKRQEAAEDYEEEEDFEEEDEEYDEEEDLEEDEDEDEEEDEEDIEYGQRVAVDDHGVLTEEEDEEDLGEYEEDLSELGSDSDEEEIDEDFSEDEDEEEEEEEF